MMRRWWLWKVEVKRVELVFVLFVLFMFCCSCCKEEESGVDLHFAFICIFVIDCFFHAVAFRH